MTNDNREKIKQYTLNNMHAHNLKDIHDQLIDGGAKVEEIDDVMRELGLSRVSITSYNVCYFCGSQLPHSLKYCSKCHNNTKENLDKHHRLQWSIYPTFASFIKQNWWILLIGSVKALNADSFFNDQFLEFLFLMGVLVGLMFVYWLVRYRIGDN